MNVVKRDSDPELADPNSRKAAHCCPHCEKLLKEAHQTEDGVRLCKECLREILSMPGGMCTECNVTVQDGQYYPDKAAQREVNQLIVVCRFKNLGCGWSDKLKDYEAHMRSCEYAGVYCPNAGCNVMLLASKLESHLSECEYRTVKCVYCDKDMVAKDLEAHNSSDCEMHPVVCERCQEEVAHRNQLADHLLHRCKFEECLICNTLVDRKTSKNVLSKDDSHSTDTSVAEDATKTIKDDDSESTTKLQQTPKSGGAKKSGPRSESRKLKQPRKSDKSTAEELDSSPPEEGGKNQFHLGQPQAVFRHMQTLATRHGHVRTEFKTFTDSTEARLVEAEGTHRSRGNEGMDDSMREMIKKMEEKIDSVSKEAERERTLRKEMEEKMDQLRKDLQAAEYRAREAMQRAEQNNREIETVKRTAERSGHTGAGGAGVQGRAGKGGGWDVGGGGNMEERVMMLEQRTEQQERETSTLKVNVSELELQLQASLASTHNGSFLWRIPEVARRRRDAIDERITSIYSPPFYTGRNGYKMCIRAYLNGDGIGYKTHFSVFFVLMKGEFDPLLKWPFEYKVSLILVDQEHRKHIVQTFKPTPESSSFKRPQSDMNVASGCPQFSKLSVLDEESYTKDDVIYLKCIVDTSRIFHP